LNRGIHVVRAIPTFPRDNNLLHNPTIGGHFAFNVPICDGGRQPNLLLRPKP
jgi:hypothetical protein